MNILTFDIEEWYLEAVLHEGGRPGKYQEYDRYLNLILDKLDEQGTKATFFCVGGMAREFPSVVKMIYDRGHEIGCHSNVHTWLNKMTPDECREDTRCAIDSLEQCIGQKVLSYRAPAFSIGESNKWAFEILAGNGIERDSSVFPAVRDFGGFPSFQSQKPCVISYNGIKIKEFPIPMANVLGKRFAYSGGGYFRVSPSIVIEKLMRGGLYSILYFHISDLIPEFSSFLSRKEYEDYYKNTGTLYNRCIRYIKKNVGTKYSMNKVLHLISSIDFENLESADDKLDWSKESDVLLNV